jgi:hypothetical protein
MGLDSMDDGQTPDRVAEAAGATATAYTQDSGLDIRKRLVDELEQGGSATTAPGGLTSSSTPSALATPVKFTADPRRKFPTS